MKVIVEITKATFGKMKLELVSACARNDYDTGECNYPIPEFPWNLGRSGSTQQYGYVKTIGDGTVAYGFVSLARNAYGIFTRNGKYFLFIHGARGFVENMVSRDLTTDDKKLSVLEYVTSGPRDMRWYETEVSYLARKGPKTIAERLVEWGETSPLRLSDFSPYYGDTALTPCVLWEEFISRVGVEEAADLVQFAAMGGQDPLRYLCCKYRNKRFDLDKCGRVDKRAFEMLPSHLQERWLKYI